MSELLMIPVELFDPDPENPQDQDAATFAALVDGIKEAGELLDAVTAVRVGEPGDDPLASRFRMIAGEHRWAASKLAGLTAIPAVVVDEASWDADRAQVQGLRMNAVRGKFDARKFAAMWTRLEGKYGREALERMAGYRGREKELRSLVGDAGRALPPKAKAALERRKEEIKSPDDLASVVKLVLAETGPVQAKASWIAFSVAGAQHMMVECTPGTYAKLRALAERCDERGWRPDDELAGMAADWLAKQTDDDEAPAEAADVPQEAEASATRRKKA